MNYTCRNCKYRNSYDCEDYNWGNWDVAACDDKFQIDFDTLSPNERKWATNIAKTIFKKKENNNDYHRNGAL